MTNPTLELTQRVLMIYQPECETVDLNTIQSHDTLLINTKNNLYSFRVINNKVMLGELSKSNTGEAIEAVLIGALVKGQDQTAALRSKLQINAQAIFLVLQNNRFIELSTSTVVGISLLKANPNPFHQSERS
jgi:hypothetical protein